MRTLIVYASKSGYAKECAQRIAQGLEGDVEIADIKKDAARKNLADYGMILAGGSVRAGHVSGSLRKFLEANKEVLLQKRLELFLCGTDPDNLETQFETHYPKELLDSAIAKEWFGGKIVFAEQNAIMRFMLKRILKGEQDVHVEKPEAVQAFITACSTASE